MPIASAAFMTMIAVTVAVMAAMVVMMMSFVSVTSVWGARARARIAIAVGSVPRMMIASRHCLAFCNISLEPIVK